MLQLSNDVKDLDPLILVGETVCRDYINFFVNKPIIRLHGIQHFGSEGGNYHRS